MLLIRTPAACWWFVLHTIVGHMALTVDQFVNHLTGSGLMSAGEVTSFFTALSDRQPPQDGEALARELVKQKKLTKFQAEQLYAGKGKSLVRMALPGL